MSLILFWLLIYNCVCVLKLSLISINFRRIVIIRFFNSSKNSQLTTWNSDFYKMSDEYFLISFLQSQHAIWLFDPFYLTKNSIKGNPFFLDTLYYIFNFFIYWYSFISTSSYLLILIFAYPFPVGKITKKLSAFFVNSALKIHSYRSLLFRRFCPQGYIHIF